MMFLMLTFRFMFPATLFSTIIFLALLAFPILLTRVGLLRREAVSLIDSPDA